MVEFMLWSAVANSSWLEEWDKYPERDSVEAAECICLSLGYILKFVMETLGLEGSSTMSVPEMVNTIREFDTYGKKIASEVGVLYRRIKDTANPSKDTVMSLYWQLIDLIDRTHFEYSKACIA